MAAIQLVVLSTTAPSTTDAIIKSLLESLGHTVFYVADATAENTTGIDGVVIADSVASGTLGTKYVAVALPVVLHEGFYVDTMGMASAEGAVSESNTQIVIVDAAHPFVSGPYGTYSGTLTVQTTQAFAYINDATVDFGAGVDQVAEAPSGINNKVGFAYESGAAMSVGNAPAKRGYFTYRDTVGDALNTDGKNILKNVYDWAFGTVTSAGFNRFSGPALLTTTAATLHTVPYRRRDRIHQIRLVNNDEDNAVAVELALGGAYAQEVLADRPVAYYRMSESSGQPQDFSGYGNHTTVTGSTPVYSQAGALASDPDNDSILVQDAEYFTAPDHSSLDLGDVFTLEAWIRPNVVDSNEHVVVSKGANGFWMGVTTDGKLASGMEGINLIVESTTTLVANTWYHAVVTKNGATAKVYLDGVDVTSPVSSQTCASTALPLVIGAEQGGAAGHFNGEIDELVVYPTALTADRVQAHYDAATIQTFFSDTLTAGESKSVRGPFTLEAAEIVQGGLHAPAMVDDFNRANEDPLSGGGNWGALGTVLPMELVSSEVVSSFAGSSVSRYLSTFGPDTQMSVRYTAAVGNVVVLMWLGVSDGNLDTYDGYAMNLTDSEGRNINITAITNGATGNASNSGDTFPLIVENDVISFSRLGSTLRVGINGTTAFEWSDSTHSAAGQVAIGVGSAGDALDDFRVGGMGPVTATIVGIRESL